MLTHFDGVALANDGTVPHRLSHPKFQPWPAPLPLLLPTSFPIPSPGPCRLSPPSPSFSPSQVPFRRGERIYFSLLISRKLPGESAVVRALRGGKKLAELMLPLPQALRTHEAAAWTHGCSLNASGSSLNAQGCSLEAQGGRV